MEINGISLSEIHKYQKLNKLVDDNDLNLAKADTNHNDIITKDELKTFLNDKHKLDISDAQIADLMAAPAGNGVAADNADIAQAIANADQNPGQASDILVKAVKAVSSLSKNDLLALADAAGQHGMGSAIVSFIHGLAKMSDAARDHAVKSCLDALRGDQAGAKANFTEALQAAATSEDMVAMKEMAGQIFGATPDPGPLLDKYLGASPELKTAIRNQFGNFDQAAKNQAAIAALKGCATQADFDTLKELGKYGYGDAGWVQELTAVLTNPETSLGVRKALASAANWDDPATVKEALNRAMSQANSWQDVNAIKTYAQVIASAQSQVENVPPANSILKDLAASLSDEFTKNGSKSFDAQAFYKAHSFGTGAGPGSSGQGSSTTTQTNNPSGASQAPSNNALSDLQSGRTAIPINAGGNDRGFPSLSGQGNDDTAMAEKILTAADIQNQVPLTFGHQSVNGSYWTWKPEGFSPAVSRLVWADNGKYVTKEQLAAMPPYERQQFPTVPAGYPPSQNLTPWKDDAERQQWAQTVSPQ